MEIPHLNFRAITASDLDSLLQLMKKYYESDHLSFSQEKARRAVEMLLKDPNLGQVWLIEDNAQTLGYVALTYGFGLEFGGRVAFVDELYVEDSFRGKGIGTTALHWCMQVCRGQGISSLRLEVTPTNSSALKLYTRLGFTNFGRSLLAYDLSSVDQKP